MPFSRRRFIGRLTLATLTAISRLGGTTLPSNEAVFEKTLFAWMEILLPSDKQGPGAGRLGVHLELIEKARGNRQYIQLLEIGVRWANKEAQALASRDFSELTSQQAVSIVAKAESKGLQTMPGLFFFHSLKDGKLFYYAHKESWAGLGFSHPPQPLGYMDFQEAPNYE